MKLFLLDLLKKIGLFLWKFCDVKLIDGFGPDGISLFIKKCSIKSKANFKVDLYISTPLLCC